MVLQKTDYIRVARLAALALLIPLLGTVFIDGWAWGPIDFIFAAVMLLGTGLALVYATKKLAAPRSRLIACSVIVFAFLLVWAQMAVGIV